MTEQGVLQDQGMNEEQRIQAEAALQDRRLDLVQQVLDLERARDLLVNRVRRLINRNISVINFSIIEENYRNLQNIKADLNLRILDWIYFKLMKKEIQSTQIAVNLSFVILLGLKISGTKLKPWNWSVLSP